MNPEATTCNLYRQACADRAVWLRAAKFGLFAGIIQVALASSVSTQTQNPRRPLFVS
jgi:hypothetical protein